MNHILQAIISTILHCKRVCPNCKRTNAIAPPDKRKTVKCKFCGTEMPPDNK
jgi:phage FluMu protein Com